MTVKTVTKQELERMDRDPAFARFMRLKNARAALQLGIPAQAVLVHVLDVLVEAHEPSPQRWQSATPPRKSAIKARS